MGPDSIREISFNLSHVAQHCFADCQGQIFCRDQRSSRFRFRTRDKGRVSLGEDICGLQESVLADDGRMFGKSLFNRSARCATTPALSWFLPRQNQHWKPGWTCERAPCRLRIRDRSYLWHFVDCLIKYWRGASARAFVLWHRWGVWPGDRPEEAVRCGKVAVPVRRSGVVNSQSARPE